MRKKYRYTEVIEVLEPEQRQEVSKPSEVIDLTKDETIVERRPAAKGLKLNIDAARRINSQNAATSPDYRPSSPIAPVSPKAPESPDYYKLYIEQ